MAENCNCSNDTGLNIFQKAAYIPVFTVGFLLNVLAIYIFLRERSSWKDTHVYTFGLALSNSILLLFLPIRTYEAFFPLQPMPFCMFLISIHYLNMYISIFTRMAISIHRCVAINFPFLKRSCGLHKQVAVMVCIVILLFSIGFDLAFPKDKPQERLRTCYERNWEPLGSGIFELLVVVGFFIPLCVITVCTIQTIYRLQKSHMERKKTGITDIMIVNLIVFIICYSPIHAAFFFKFYRNECTCPILKFYHISAWMATTNCCWDAVGYYFLFRRFFKSQKLGCNQSQAAHIVASSTKV